jgi:circadian clock protein KaiB
VSLRLYVAGRSPNSVRAMNNLSRICAEQLGDAYELEVVDVLRQPLRALLEGVVLTPTLVRVAPTPAIQLLGDLSDEPAVRAALGAR